MDIIFCLTKNQLVACWLMNTLRSNFSFWFGWRLDLASKMNAWVTELWCLNSLLQKPASESSWESHPTFYCQKPNTWAFHTLCTQCWAEEPASASLSISPTQNKGALTVPSKNSSLLSLIAGSSSEWWISEERGYLFLSLLRNRNNRGSFPGVQCIRINTVKLGRCLERWLATCAIKITSEASVSPRYISKAVCWPRLCQKSVVAVALCINKNLLMN